MSEIGDRIRNLFHEIAPPADLGAIVQQEKPPFRRPVRRAVAYVGLVLALVSVTGLVALLARGGDPVTSASSSTSVSTTSTSAPASTSVSSTTTKPPVTDTVPLVPRSEWPDPALAPVLGLPSCWESGYLPSFIAEEFPETAGSSFETVAAAEVATVAAMPRIGSNSVFPDDVLDGGCLESGRVGDVTGWALISFDGELIARAAARPQESRVVPEEVITHNYHQSRIASWHLFSASVDATGRTWGLVGGSYYVLDAQNVLPDGDLHLAGERLASSLAIRPFVDDNPRFERGSSGLTHPTGLPEGYGLCVAPRLVLELSGEGADWFRTVFCTEQGEYLELLTGMGGNLPPEPSDASVLDFGPLSGTTWTEDGRLNVAINPIGQMNRSDMWLWMTSPTNLDSGTLRAVLLSTLILQPEIVEGRKGRADLPDEIDPQILADIVATSGDDNAVSRLNTFPDQELSLVETALAMGANSTVSFKSVDALVRDRGDSVQVIFSCGDVWFNSSFDPASGMPKDWSQDWSQQDGRYERILTWIDTLLDEIGCEAPR